MNGGTMICPKCSERVDPVTSEHWMDHLNNRDDPDSPADARTVLTAILLWDQSAMYFRVNGVSGQSVLPTELRDAVSGAIG